MIYINSDIYTMPYVKNPQTGTDGRWFLRRAGQRHPPALSRFAGAGGRNLELTHALGIIQPVVSRHLAVLREAQIVVDRREGVWIHYRINERLPQWVREILQSTADGLAGSEPFKSDLAALRDMPNRPGASACA